MATTANVSPVSSSSLFPGGALKFDFFVSLPGAPLSSENAIAVLRKHKVTVGLAIIEAWEARNARLDAAWVRTFFPCYKFSDTTHPCLRLHLKFPLFPRRKLSRS